MSPRLWGLFPESISCEKVEVAGQAMRSTKGLTGSVVRHLVFAYKV